MFNWDEGDDRNERIAELDARIAELEAENARLTQACSDEIDTVAHLRRRLAAVLALCEDSWRVLNPDDVRAAAAGDE